MPTILIHQASDVAIPGAILSTDGPNGMNPGVGQTLTPVPASMTPLPPIEDAGGGLAFGPAEAGDVILLQDQPNPANNGVWTVTSDGTGAPPNDFWLLTRHPDADEPSDWPISAVSNADLPLDGIPNPF